MNQLPGCQTAMRDEPIPDPLIYFVTCYPNELMRLLQKAVDTEKELTCKQVKVKQSFKKFVIVGNWKMNGSKDSIKQLISMLNRASIHDNTEVIIAVPSIYLVFVRNNLSPKFNIAAQNCYTVSNGAFTGEISAPMIKDIGCTWVVLGHLERRVIFGETDQLIGEKIKYALSEGLNILVCSGETKEDKDSGKADDVIRRQIINITENVDKNQWNKIVIAYEAFWTVGTGQSLPVKEAQRILKSIRAIIAERVSQHIAEQARLIYAGSVNTENCKEFAVQPDIDGLLVGGASLKPEFVDIINVAKRI